MEKLYSYAEVFYKETETPGWNIALISGNENEVENKVKNKWKKYKIFSGHKSINKIEDIYPINPEPEMTHLTSNWIWSSELNKWFFEEEIIPLQKENFLKVNFLNFDLEFPDDQNETSELYELYQENLEENQDIVEIYADVLFTTLNNNLEIQLQYSNIIANRINKFIDCLKNGKYAHLIIDEYYYLKILSWPIKDKYRVVFQDYNGHTVVNEPIRIEIEKEEFIIKMEQLYEQLNSFYNKKNIMVRNYKK